MRTRRVSASLLAVFASACASAGKPRPPLDLAPARQALEHAREAGAAEKAPEPFGRAEDHLKEAEKLAVSARPDDFSRAGTLAELVQAEASCAATMAGLVARESAAAAVPATQEPDRLAAQLHKAQEEQKRLQQQVEVLQRDLDLTETEVIRTKAKLKGLDSKAEASAAIAETRILMRRAADERGRTENVLRCQRVLDTAEQQLRGENYAAAAWLAVKARGLLDVARVAGVRTEPDPPAAKKAYVVKVGSANLRDGPAPDGKVIGRVPRGATLQALATRGDWVKVIYGDLSGWVSLSLLE